MRLISYVLICFLSSCINAEAKISGEIGLIYKVDDKTSSNGDAQEVEFNQFLGLTYTDYIYNPNLLYFDIHTQLEHKQVDTSNNGSSGDSNSQDYQYNIDLHFFQRAYFPFNIYSKKTIGEVSTTATSSSARNIQDTISHGLNGRVQLESFWIDYLADIDMIDRESSFTNETRSTKKFELIVGKTFDLKEARIDFLHDENEVTLNDSIASSIVNNVNKRDAVTFYLDSNKANMNVGYEVNELENKENDVNYINGDKGSKEERYSVSYNYRPSNDFTLNTSARYTTNAEEAINNQDTIVDIFWHVNDKLDIMNNMFRTSLDADGQTTDTYNFDLSANYKYHERLNFSGRLNSFLTQSVTDKNYVHIIDGGIDYVQPFAQRYMYTFNARIGASTESHTDASLENKTSLTGSVDNMLSVRFETHKSRLDIGLNFYNLSTSLKEKNRRIRFSTDFMGYPLDRLRYLIGVNYINSLNHSYDNTLKKLSDPNKTERWESNFKLDYTQALGVKGKLFAGVGVRNTVYLTPESLSALSIYADTTLSYRVFSSLFYTLRGNVRSDSLNGTTEYSLYNEMSYTLRQIKLSLNNEFWSAQSDAHNENQVRTMLQASRSF